jgi:hypothetical protein
MKKIVQSRKLPWGIVVLQAILPVIQDLLQLL